MEELQLLIRKTGLSPMDFCKEAGISYGVWRRRVKNPLDFTVREINALRSALGLKKSDVDRIFFAL